MGAGCWVLFRPHARARPRPRNRVRSRNRPGRILDWCTRSKKMATLADYGNDYENEDDDEHEDEMIQSLSFNYGFACFPPNPLRANPFGDI